MYRRQPIDQSMSLSPQPPFLSKISGNVSSGEDYKNNNSMAFEDTAAASLRSLFDPLDLRILDARLKPLHFPTHPPSGRFLSKEVDWTERSYPQRLS